jgi:hypothetical protein
VREIELARPYLYCVPCRQGLAPLDAALGVAPGHRRAAGGDQAGRRGALRDGPRLVARADGGRPEHGADARIFAATSAVTRIIPARR